MNLGDRKNRVLSIRDHDRAFMDMTWVYPVLSRRSGGVSVGINLNPNNACNWRCIYCQVPGLVRGAAPRTDLAELGRELEAMLAAIVTGSFLRDAAPGETQLADIAFSGNGEPTTSRDLEAAIAVVGDVLERFGLSGRVPLVLITNGSMLSRPSVQRAVSALARLDGQVWFKLDRATAQAMRRINGTRSSPDKQLEKLALAASLCKTWVQSCWFSERGANPPAHEQAAFLACLGRLAAQGVPISGVQLYTLARPSMQPEAAELAPVPSEWLEAFAARVRAHGFEVRVAS